MSEFILSLPTVVGVSVVMIFTVSAGFSVHYVAYRFIEKYHGKDLVDATSSLFRVVGMLVSLMLSLAFAEVVVDLSSIENAIDRETSALSDIYYDLKFFNSEKSLATRDLLIEYAQSVVEDDWPALANDKLGERTGELRRQLAAQVLSLKPTTPMQEKLWERILADVDLVSDYRMFRLDNALEKPPIYIYVIVIGFLITTACFGAYRPQPPVVLFLSLYCLFIGFVLYLILSLSDPFQGRIGGIDTAAFDYLIETLKADKA